MLGHLISYHANPHTNICIELHRTEITIIVKIIIINIKNYHALKVIS